MKPRTAVVALAAVCVDPASSAGTARMPATYDVAADGLHVGYNIAVADAQPRLIYVGPLKTLTFSGPEFRVGASADLGTLPASDVEAHVEVVAVTTVHTASTGCHVRKHDQEARRGSGARGRRAVYP